MINETAETARSRAPSDGIRTVTGATFDALISRAAGPIAVEFMSYGCSHCGEIEPVLQRVAEMVKAKGRIFRVNVEAERGLSDRYEIRATPTFVMFLNGSEVGRSEGPPPTVSAVLTAVTRPFRGMK